MDLIVYLLTFFRDFICDAFFGDFIRYIYMILGISKNYSGEESVFRRGIGWMRKKSKEKKISKKKNKVIFLKNEGFEWRGGEKLS